MTKSSNLALTSPHVLTSGDHNLKIKNNNQIKSVIYKNILPDKPIFDKANNANYFKSQSTADLLEIPTQLSSRSTGLNAQATNSKIKLNFPVISKFSPAPVISKRMPPHMGGGINDFGSRHHIGLAHAYPFSSKYPNSYRKQMAPKTTKTARAKAFMTAVMDKDEQLQLPPQYCENLLKEVNELNIKSLLEESDGMRQYLIDQTYKQTYSQNFYALIRHGERADNIDLNVRDSLGIEIQDINDPPLTPQGFEHALDQANYLKKTLTERGYTKIVIEASPFLRTMQTAATFATVLGVKRIEINCLLAKWMRGKKRTKDEKRSDFNPFNHLLVEKFEKENKQEFVDKFLNGIDFYSDCPTSITESMEYNFVKTSYPETINNVIERVKMLQKQFLADMKQNVFEKQGEEGVEKVAHLYFTHGTLLQEFSALNEKECKQEWAKYCSISAIEVGLNKIGSQTQKELVLDLHCDIPGSLSAQLNDKQSQVYIESQMGALWSK